MPAKREYKVKGTNDFIVLAAIFFFLCLWAIKDAWFPSDKVLKKHPLQVDAAFEVSGAVHEIRIAEGDSVAENQLLATLRTDRAAVEYDKAKETYAEAKKTHAKLEQMAKDASADTIQDVMLRLETSQKEMDAVLAGVNDLRAQLDSSELKSPTKGEILKVLVSPHTMVEAGETAFVIDPKDHFYLFNKSLTILSFILFWVFLAIHILAR